MLIDYTKVIPVECVLEPTADLHRDHDYDATHAYYVGFREARGIHENYNHTRVKLAVSFDAFDLSGLPSDDRGNFTWDRIPCDVETLDIDSDGAITLKIIPKIPQK